MEVVHELAALQCRSVIEKEAHLVLFSSSEMDVYSQQRRLALQQPLHTLLCTLPLLLDAHTSLKNADLHRLEQQLRGLRLPPTPVSCL